MKEYPSPRDLMHGYQRAYDADRSRFKLWVAARQIGKSLTSTNEPVEDCALRDQRGDKTDWILVSAGERQALELMSRAKMWAEAYSVALDDVVEKREGSSETVLLSSTIVWPNGSRIIALPANPATMRGYSANVLLDEFAYHENPDAIWKAAFPIVTSPHGGEKKLRVVSTANGQGNKFYDLAHKNPRFRVHRTSILDAVEGGLAAGRDIQAYLDELREALADDEAWAQEYLCEFIDVSGVLLTYELIGGCETPECSDVAPAGFWARESYDGPAVDIGIDFGRKRDLSVAWSVESVSDLKITKEVLTMEKTPTPQQVEILRPRIERARRVCLDYTGPGVGLGDYLVQEFGEYDPAHHRFGKVELCTASNAFNVEIFSKLRMGFEKRSIRIPVKREIREDLHSVYRQATKTGSISYRAPHTADGHADRCYALALANRAASLNLGHCDPSAIRIGGGGLFKRQFTPRRLVAQR